MFEQFEKYLLSKARFTHDELQLMHSLCAIKKLRRRELLLHEGEVCNTKTFVVKGLLRAFQPKDDGSEPIMRFTAENAWMIDHESYTYHTPSRYCIEALENSSIICWTKENVNKLYEQVPAFRIVSEQLREQSMKESQQRILINISYSAEEKYKAFVAANENVFRRIPLHMVASYLGVSRETLSRVRHSEYSRQK